MNMAFIFDFACWERFDNPKHKCENSRVNFLHGVDEQLKRPHVSSFKNRRILESFMVATHPDLTSTENVSALSFVEAEIVRFATRNAYDMIFTINISPVTRVSIFSFNLSNVKSNLFAYKTREFRISVSSRSSIH
jgi:hypothetical protein